MNPLLAECKDEIVRDVNSETFMLLQIAYEEDPA